MKSCSILSLSDSDTVSGIEASIQHMSDKYDEVLERMAQQVSDMSEVESRIVKLEKGRCQKK